jgi:transcriptional regulator with XRE-family HTH domain
MEKFGILFGRLIREKRGIEQLSQDDLAGKSGLTKAHISNIENGKIKSPQTKTVDALCVALNISRGERDACHVITGQRLPPRLLENLALRFGHSNPDALEDELEAFLKEKAIEFRDMQERLAQMNWAEGRITDLLAAANAALEEGDFQIADERLAEAEDAQLASATLPALERQCRLRFERGHAALLSGEIGVAAQHWEAAANFFHFIAQESEAEKRYEYCGFLREHGYRYRSAEALRTAGNALERNLPIWSKEDNLRNWCRAMIALGGVSLRLSQLPPRCSTWMEMVSPIFGWRAVLSRVPASAKRTLAC